MQKEFLSVEEAATVLGLHAITVRRMARSGALPAIKVGKQWRFPRGQFEEWSRVRVPAESPAAMELGELDAESQAWLEAGLETAAEGIEAAEEAVPMEEHQAWWNLMAGAVRPLEGDHA